MSSYNYHFPITLAMIVKDEEHIIARCLDSVKDHITGYVIIDTGSTDNTKAIIEKELAGIPGIILDRPWVDFGYNRTELVQEARTRIAVQKRSSGNFGYLLLLDADHTIEGDFTGVGDADGYLIQLVGGEIVYRMPYLVGADIPWKYFCRTHEYIGTEGVPFQYEDLDSVTIRHFGDGGTRHEKFERDLKYLEEDYASDPNNERHVYYLAQTLESVGQNERAIEMYDRRVSLGGWDQEVFWALFRKAEITQKIEDYLAAWLYRPSRSEPLQRAAKLLNNIGNHAGVVALCKAAPQKPTDDYFFVERWTENYGLAFEYCLASFYTGSVQAAKFGWEEILKLEDVKPEYRESCQNNLTFC